MIETVSPLTRRHLFKLRSQQGLTLLEVLVVVVIAAILVSMVVVTWSSDPIKEGLKSASDDLRFKLSYGFEEALMRSTDLGLFVYEDGYRWAQWVVEESAQSSDDATEDAVTPRAKWVLMPSTRPWSPVELDDDYRLTLQSGQPYEPIVLKPQPEKTEPEKPEADAMILPLMAHGETYPSLFTITHQDTGRAISVTISEFGEVTVVDTQENL